MAEGPGSVAQVPGFLAQVNMCLAQVPGSGVQVPSSVVLVRKKMRDLRHHNAYDTDYRCRSPSENWTCATILVSVPETCTTSPWTCTTYPGYLRHKPGQHNGPAPHPRAPAPHTPGTCATSLVSVTDLHHIPRIPAPHIPDLHQGSRPEIRPGGYFSKCW